MKTFKFGVLGHNIAYSLSPKIFNTIFNYSKIEGETSILDWSLEELQTKSKDLLGFDGLSVTIPYKTEIVQYIDHIKKPAGFINSVNSIHNVNNKLIGYNTDYQGFIFPLKKYSNRIKDSSLLLYGFGGSARAILYGLINEYNISQIKVIIRDKTKSKNIHKYMNNLFPNLSISVSSFDDPVDFSDYKLVVNSTPLGGVNFPDNLPFGNKLNFDVNTIYYDLNYNSNNKAIKLAKDNNMTTIDGKQMLIAQAIESFKLWTTKNVAFDDIYNDIFTETD